MFANNVARRFACLTAGVAVALGSVASGASAQTAASQESIRQAIRNTNARLISEDYTLPDPGGDYPRYTTFLRTGQNQTVTASDVTPGRYVLVIGGDDDTIDLDLDFGRFGDTDHKETGLVEFTVHSRGRIAYEIEMANCRTANCGVYAALLRVGN